MSGVEMSRSDLEYDDENMEPMAVTSSVEKGRQWVNWFTTTVQDRPRRYKLIDDKDARQKSMYTLQFAVTAAAINTKMLNPNYAIMVTPGASDDSFPDTEPFEFNSATYFLPMTSLLGVAIASIFLGTISDRRGRKPVLLVLAVVSGIGSIVKYFLKETFWGFCIGQFVFGFFLGNLPVAMAYIGDIFVHKTEKERQLSIIVANYVMGNSGGGIIAILMKGSGLFSPLWVGAGLMFLSAISIVWWLIEPGDERLQPLGKEVISQEMEDNDIPRPEELDKKTMWNVVIGALADNFGSTALFPLCLSPLALETYTYEFYENDEAPIMSVVGYQWLSVCVAFMVVPSTFVTPYIFSKLGVAGTCVIGNAFTGILTITLLMIATYGPATTAGFAGFVFCMYAGFPITVWSQLTTGPMLDLLAPEDKIGYVQGLNNAAMNFGMATAPWLLGLLADGAGTNTAIWTGVGISFGAALINTPLIFHKGYGPAEKKKSRSKTSLPGEDSDLIEKALSGDFFDQGQLWLINLDRVKKRQPPIVPKVRPYEEDKDALCELIAHAEESFLTRSENQNLILAKLANPDAETDLQEFCDMLNESMAGEPEAIKEANSDLGRWVGDYLADNGYNPHLNSIIIKQMVLSAFPSISREKKFTPETIRANLLRSNQVMNEYLSLEERKKYTRTKMLSSGAIGRFYS